MTGKHHQTSARRERSPGAARSTPARATLLLLLGTRWRQLTGAASATAIAFCLLACACALVAVAGPRTSAQLRTNAFRQLAATTPAADKTVVGTLDAGTLGAAVTPPVSAQQIGMVQADLRKKLGGLVPLGPMRGDWGGLTAPFTGFADHSREVGTDNTQLELVYRNDLGKHVRVVAGSLPAGSPGTGATTTLQVAITAATAKRFNLGVGSHVPLPGAGILLQVTGILAPVGPGGPFWSIDPITAAPAVVIPQRGEPYWQGGAFVSAAAVSGLQSQFTTTDIQLTWMFPLAIDHLTAAQAVALSQRMATVLSSAGQLVLSSAAANVNFSNEVNVNLVSGVIGPLGAFAEQISAVSNVLDLMSVSLAVVGAAVVLLAAWLMAEKRREEFAVLRARGASRRQLAAAAFWASAIAAVPGAVIGIAVAVALTPGAGSSLSWWLAGLTVLAALAGPVAITVRVHRGYAAITRPDRPAGRISSARRLIAESALALGAIGGLIVLRDQGIGPRGGDLYASAAPILAAIPVAIIMLRLYPLLVRPLLRLSAGRAGVTAFLGLARAARVSATAVLPAFAMVLALSLVSFAGMVRGAVVRGELTQSWQQAGADAVITVPNSMSAAQQRAMTAVPGVQHSVPVGLATSLTGTGGKVSVIVADPAQYAALLAATPFGQPPARFGGWRGGTGGGQAGPVPALGSPGLAAQLGGRVTTLHLQDAQSVRIRVVGTAPAMSHFEALGGQDVRGYVVLPRPALGSSVPAPSAMLLVGPNLDAGALAATVARWHVPGTSVTLRTQLLTALESAPLQLGAYSELAFGGDAAAIGCMLVLLLTLMLSAQSRQMTLARAATMGMSAAQGRWLALIEALPQILSVVIGGLACALILAPLVGPSLGLSVFTGSVTSVPVRIDPVWLAGTALALLVLAIATLAGQMVLAGRQAPRSLRIGG